MHQTFIVKRRKWAQMTTGAVLLIALGAGQAVQAQTAVDSSAPSDVSSPTTDLLAQTIARSLSAMQQRALALNAPQFVTGQPLSLTGTVYFPGGADGPWVDQKLAYANGGMVLNVGCKSVSQNVSGVDLLAYRTGIDASLPDALSQLLSQRGQSDLNAELGLTGLHGLKLDYKVDAQTNALTNGRATNQSFLLEKDSHASVFSFLHGVASSGTASGDRTTATDELKYAYAPGSGLSLTGDASTSQGEGKAASQWRIGMGEKLSHLNFSGEFWSSDANAGATGGNTRQGGEKFALDGQVAPAVTVTGFYDHEMVATDQAKSKEEFDATVKSMQAHHLELMAEFARTQQMAQAAQSKQRLQAIWSLPRFIGVTSAKWAVGLTDQTLQDQSLRRDISIGFESQVPGRYAALPGLSGATLHLEYAGNSIGATPSDGGATNTPARQHSTMRHSRLLRLVSAPRTSKWLTWSVAQQTRVGDQGAMLPMMRDYEVKGVISPALSVSYSDRDQLPQDDGTMRDTKTRTLSVAVTPPHSAQIVAAFVHGADLSNGVAGQDSVSVGLTGASGADQTMSLSLGRDRRTKLGGSPITGTTCKTAFGWREDAKNRLGFNGTLTAWDHSASEKTDSIDAEANLHFERVY